MEFGLAALSLLTAGLGLYAMAAPFLTAAPAAESLAWLRARVDGRDLVAELLDERRAEVSRDA